MKKWGLLLVALTLALGLLLPTVAVAATPVLADSYSETHQNDVATVYDGLTLAAGQSFTAIAGTLDSAKFYVRKHGSPTGTVRAVLYAHTGTFGDGVGTGLPLATSAPVDIATALGTTFSLVTFNFDNTVALSAGTKYVIGLEPGAGIQNGNDYVEIGDEHFGSHPGNESTKLADGSWFPWGDWDMCFYVYETPPAPVSTPASSWWSVGLLAALGLGLAVKSRRVIFS